MKTFKVIVIIGLVVFFCTLLATGNGQIAFTNAVMAAVCAFSVYAFSCIFVFLFFLAVSCLVFLALRPNKKEAIVAA